MSRRRGAVDRGRAELVRAADAAVYLAVVHRAASGTGLASPHFDREAAAAWSELTDDERAELRVGDVWLDEAGAHARNGGAATGAWLCDCSRH